jgi:uncharacterized protein with von Willebrand factor type A (vWA) domain
MWLEPLEQDTDHQPLARGMAAAIPAVDVLAGGYAPGSLEDVAGLLADPPAPRP